MLHLDLLTSGFEKLGVEREKVTKERKSGRCFAGVGLIVVLLP